MFTDSLVCPQCRGWYRVLRNRSIRHQAALEHHWSEPSQGHHSKEQSSHQGEGKISLLGLFHLLISVEGTTLPFQAFWWFQSRDIANSLVSYSSHAVSAGAIPMTTKRRPLSEGNWYSSQKSFASASCPRWASAGVTIFLIGSWPLLKCPETTQRRPMNHVQMTIPFSYHWLSPKTHSS